MRRLARNRPSPAMIVALIALFISLTGASYAALAINSVGTKQLKKNAVTGAKIKKNAVTGAKVKDGSLSKGDFAAGQLPAGPKGDKGDKGAPGEAGKQGPPGVAVGYARVGADGTLDAGTPTQNKNVVQANVQHDAVASATTTGPGVYCFGGLPFTPTSAMVTADAAMAISTTNMIVSVAVQRGNNLNNCDAEHQQARVSVLAVDQTNPPTLTNHGFYIWFEDE